jgi:hypothetical protein
LRTYTIREVETRRQYCKNVKKIQNQLLKKVAMYALQGNVGIEKFIRMKHVARNKCLMKRALEQMKFFMDKMREYKKDPITKQFIHYDNAVIQTDKPGQPLLVTESNDSC